MEVPLAFSVRRRRGADQEPAVFAIASPKAKLDLQFAPEFAGAGPFGKTTFQVVRMNHESHPIAILSGRDADLVAQPLVVEDGGPPGLQRQTTAWRGSGTSGIRHRVAEGEARPPIRSRVRWRGSIR